MRCNIFLNARQLKCSETFCLGGERHVTPHAAIFSRLAVLAETGVSQNSIKVMSVEHRAERTPHTAVKYTLAALAASRSVVRGRMYIRAAVQSVILESTGVPDKAKRSYLLFLRATRNSRFPLSR